MNSYIISIRPEWVKKIVDREKTFEVRKSAPKEVPFKAYIYVTKDGINGRSSEVLLLNKHTGEVGFGDYRNACHYGKDDFEICNGHVVGEFICDKVEKFYCASVPYQKENNLGYGQFVDNGVYKVNNWHEGVVFERNDRYIDSMLNNNDLKEMCLSAQELFDYIGIGKHLYGWHISDLKIYDKPKELSEFRKALDRVYCSYFKDYCEEGCVSFGNTDYSCNDYWNWEKGLTRPPQSYMRVEELGE